MYFIGLPFSFVMEKFILESNYTEVSSMRFLQSSKWAYVGSYGNPQVAMTDWLRIQSVQYSNFL